MAVNATRLQGIDGTNATDLTRAEVETRIQAWEIHKFLQKYVGGFEKSYILDTGAQVGVRETRHIRGDYQLTEEDVLANRAFDDGIACGTFAIDIHHPEGEQQVFTGSGRPFMRCLTVRCFTRGSTTCWWTAGASRLRMPLSGRRAS